MNHNIQSEHPDKYNVLNAPKSETATPRKSKKKPLIVISIVVAIGICLVSIICLFYFSGEIEKQLWKEVPSKKLLVTL